MLQRGTTVTGLPREISSLSSLSQWRLRRASTNRSSSSDSHGPREISFETSNGERDTDSSSDSFALSLGTPRALLPLPRDSRGRLPRASRDLLQDSQGSCSLPTLPKESETQTLHLARLRSPSAERGEALGVLSEREESPWVSRGRARTSKMKSLCLALPWESGERARPLGISKEISPGPRKAPSGVPREREESPWVYRGRARTSEMKSLCLALPWESRRRSLEARGSPKKKIDLWRPFEVSIGRAKRARRSPLGVPSLLYLSATQCDL